MALINNLYVHVTDEEWQSKVNSTSHPVEKGINLTDTVKNEALELSISGLIVDAGDKKSTAIIAKLEELRKAGSLITYKGRKTASNLQIQSFSTSHPNTVWDGCEFSMELKEVRIAKKAYTATAKKTTTPAKTTKKVEIKVGSIVVFKGGPVYVSSDAKKAAATRGRSTCKCTSINTKSWSVHSYHLISTDGKKVYGWVDKANIEGTTATAPVKTNDTKKNGTQQTTSKIDPRLKMSEKKIGIEVGVYHTVKKGDTVYNLVNKTYKNLGKTVQWVIDKNPSAFKKKGDPTTLQVGKKLLMGYKKQ